MTLMTYLTRRARRMLTPRQLDRDVSQWVVQALARFLGTFAVVYGAFTIVGGRVRWSGPSFATALSVPGAPASWGFFIGLAGVLVVGSSLAGRTRLVTVGLYMISLWAILFAGTFAKTWWDRPDASIGAALTSFLIAGFAIVLAVAHWKSSQNR